ncbi:MAG TPA: hypothetical protein VNK96_06800 [Fimbriimonadales bacterium]|nr:hypothetical protein [Fimbriimonadales bacterium]
MKKMLFLISIAAFSLSAFAQTHAALGNGTIGEYKKFDLLAARIGDVVGGSVQFHAATNTGIIAINAKVQKAIFEKNAVHTAGEGMLNDKHVFVEVLAVDGTPEHKPDFFSIRVFNKEGNVVFEASGAVIHGNIIVKHSKT